MDIVITQWALDAYLDLKHNNAFNTVEFNEKIKPDVKLLLKYPNAPKFNNGKFWSPAFVNHKPINNGFKMKWHQIGNEKVDKRKLAKFKTHLQLIQQGQYKQCGVML
jgi:hypothetical protein